MWYAYCVSGLFCLELSRAIKLSEDRPPFWAYDVTSVERVSLTRGSVYFDYTVLLFGILSRFGNSLYSAMLFFFWLILCNLGSLRDVSDYCSLHNSHNCHIKMMKKREWPVRHHDTIISKKKIFWPLLDFSQGRERYHTGGPYGAWRHPSPVRHYKWNSVPWFKSRFEGALS